MATQPPLVSIIIPCFNQAKFVRAAIESALNQTYSNLEVIVVDDGSTDETASVLGELRPRVVAISQSNRGLSGARNTGFENCNGDYVLFLDSDDLLETHIVEHCVTRCETQGADLVFFGFVTFESDSKIDYSRASFAYQSSCLATILCNSRFAVHSVMFAKHLVEDPRPFDENLRSHEDFEFWWQLAMRDPISIHCSEIGAFYRRHGDNMSRNLRHMCETRAEVLCKLHTQLMKHPLLLLQCGSDFANELLRTRRDVVLTKADSRYFAQLTEALNAFNKAGFRAYMPWYLRLGYRAVGSSFDVFMMSIARPILRWRYQHP